MLTASRPSASPRRKKSKRSRFDEEARVLEALDAEAQAAARDGILPFTLYTFPEYRVNWHHELIAAALDDFAAGKIKRLLIEGPPQATGKSELVSRKLPAYIFGKNPKAKIICGSYTADLVESMSRDVQRVMESSAYLELFPEVKIGGGLTQKDEEFVTPQGGVYKCAGMGGGITGRPGDFAILDDILKGRLEANSPTIRNKAWAWLQDEVLTRIGAHGGCLLMATRWHEDDPTGRILKQQTEDMTRRQWTHICLPARLDREQDRMPGDPRKIGETLWPWYYAGKPNEDPSSPEYLTPAQQAEKARDFLLDWETGNPYGFSSLAQQRPTPLKGEFFNVEKFRIVEHMPPGTCIKDVRYWDKAASVDKTAKRTAGVRMSKWKLDDGTEAICVNHAVRGRWAPGDREAVMLQTARVDGKKVTIGIEKEGGSGGIESADASARRLRGYRVKLDSPTGDKITRAEPFAIEVNSGVVYMLKGAWNMDYLDELRNFSPAAALKDQVDASSGAYCELEKGGNWRALIS